MSTNEDVDRNSNLFATIRLHPRRSFSIGVFSCAFPGYFIRQHLYNFAILASRRLGQTEEPGYPCSDGFDRSKLKKHILFSIGELLSPVAYAAVPCLILAEPSVDQENAEFGKSFFPFSCWLSCCRRMMQCCLFYNSKKAVSFLVTQLFNEKIQPSAVNPPTRLGVSILYCLRKSSSERSPTKKRCFCKTDRDVSPTIG